MTEGMDRRGAIWIKTDNGTNRELKTDNGTSRERMKTLADGSFESIEPMLSTETFAKMIEQNANFSRWVTQNDIWARRIDRITDGDLTLRPERNPYYALRAWEIASLIPEPDRNGYIDRGTWPNYLPDMTFVFSNKDSFKGSLASLGGLITVRLDFTVAFLVQAVEVEIYLGSTIAETGAKRFHGLKPTIRKLWSDYEENLDDIEEVDALIYVISDANIRKAIRALVYRLYLEGFRASTKRGPTAQSQMHSTGELSGQQEDLSQLRPVFSGADKIDRSALFYSLELAFDTETFQRTIDAVPKFRKWVEANNVWARRAKRIGGEALVIERDEDPFYKIRAWELARVFFTKDGAFDRYNAARWDLLFKNVRPYGQDEKIGVRVSQWRKGKGGDGDQWRVSINWTGSWRARSKTTSETIKDGHQKAIMQTLEGLGFEFDRPKPSRSSAVKFDAGEALDGKPMDQLTQLFYALYTAQLRFVEMTNSSSGQMGRQVQTAWKSRFKSSTPLYKRRTQAAIRKKAGRGVPYTVGTLDDAENSTKDENGADIKNVALIVIYRGYDFLMVRLRKDQKWKFPGGVIERDETPWEAAWRKWKAEAKQEMPEKFDTVFWVDYGRPVAHTRLFIVGVGIGTPYTGIVRDDKRIDMCLTFMLDWSKYPRYMPGYVERSFKAFQPVIEIALDFYYDAMRDVGDIYRDIQLTAANFPEEQIIPSLPRRRRFPREEGEEQEEEGEEQEEEEKDGKV